MRIWCDHCQDHYEGDHYDPDSGEHRVGQEYGRAGVSLAAEQIVRALAASDPQAFDDSANDYFCGLCGLPGQHEPSCPWRLAREWVAATG